MPFLHRFVAANSRNIARDWLLEDGFKMIGEDPTPLDKSTVKKLFSRLSSEHLEKIDKFAYQVVGEVPLPVTRLGDVWEKIKEWFSVPENREKAMRIAKFILTILFMFI
jgi:hypothetical protein